MYTTARLDHFVPRVMIALAQCLGFALTGYFTYRFASFTG